MATIITTLLVTSLMDSLNPSAIAQTLLFLGNEKRKSKILIFILAMFITNSALGLAVYYGALTPLMKEYEWLNERYPALVLGLSIGLGCISILLGLGLGLRKYLKSRKNSGQNVEEKGKKPVDGKPISAVTMFFMGVFFTGVEITTALLYFGFLTNLVSQGFSFIVILLLIFLYSLIYCLPLLIIYFVYVVFKNARFIESAWISSRGVLLTREKSNRWWVRKEDGSYCLRLKYGHEKKIVITKEHWETGQVIIQLRSENKIEYWAKEHDGFFLGDRIEFTRKADGKKFVWNSKNEIFMLDGLDRREIKYTTLKELKTNLESV